MTAVARFFLSAFAPLAGFGAAAAARNVEADLRHRRLASEQLDEQLQFLAARTGGLAGQRDRDAEYCAAG